MTARMIECISLIAGLALAGCGMPPEAQSVPLRHSSESVDLDKADMTRVELRMGAGEVKVSGGAVKLLEADFAYDDPASKPLVKHNASNFRG